MNLQIPSLLNPLFTGDYETYIIHGGRASGKSWGVRDFIIMKSLEGQYFIQCSREVGSAIDASSKKLIYDGICQKNLLPFYHVTDSEIINKKTETKIIFKGLKGGSKAETRTRLRSSEGIDILWCEEAQFIQQDTLIDLDPTIRGLNRYGKKRIKIFTLNPYDNPDPVFSFYEKQSNVCHIEINLSDNPWAPESEIRKSNEMLKADPLLWQHVYGGRPNTLGDRAVISGEQYNACVKRPWNGNEQEVIGIDVGRMGDDRTVMVRRKGNAMIEYKSFRKQTLDVTFEDIKRFVKHKYIPIRIDSTGLAGLEDFLRRDGWNVKGINFANKSSDPKYGKGAGSIINEMWFSFADKIDTISLPYDKDLQYELTTRQYTYDAYGLRKIQSKDKYKANAGKSPDIADAVILAFYDVTYKKIIYRR